MNKNIASSQQVMTIIGLLFLTFNGCRPDPILPPGPNSTINSIKVEAKVPTSIYSNVKKVFLDASVTPSLNSQRELSFSWVCNGFPMVSGSPVVTYSNLPVATVEKLQIGEYKFQLTIKDNLGNIHVSNYQLEVLEDSIKGKIPIVNAGPDQLITAPKHQIQLDGYETIPFNPTGRTLFFDWSVIQQPAGSYPVGIINSADPLTIATGLQEGVYLFQLKVTNEYGMESMDTLQVNVLPDALNGTSRIIEKVMWKNVHGDNFDSWGPNIFITIKDPDLFLNRYIGNMEVRLWDEEKKDWKDATEYLWSTSTSGELIIEFPGPYTEEYYKMDGVETRVRVNFY